jgi:hypothetical protein
MNITKEWLLEKDACKGGIKWFLSQDEIDAGKVMLKLIDCDRVADARWVMRKLIATKTQAVLIAIFAAEPAIDIFENKYPDDKRPRKAIEAAKAYIDNPCENTRLAANHAYHAAYAAAYAAYAAAYAAADAAYAAADAAAAADYHDYHDCGKKETQVKIIKYAITVLGL